MSTLYLLDRNVVSDIKLAVDGKPLPKEKVDRVEAIKSIDVAGNFVSPILSLIEGEIGAESSRQELHACLMKETDYIERFFQNAYVDSNIIRDDSSDFASVFSEFIEEKWYACYGLLEFSNDYLIEPMNKSDAKKYHEGLFLFSDWLGIPASHPVLACCISSSLGFRSAHKIIKPKRGVSGDEKQKRFYNSVSDLMSILWISVIRSIMQNNRLNLNVKFFSFDKALNEFLELVWTSCSIDNDGQVSLKIGYQQELFPKLDDDEYKNLTERMGARGSYQ